MIARRRSARAFPHVALWLAIAVILFPIYFVLVAIYPGSHFLENYGRALLEGAKNLGASAFTMSRNSLIMALGIAVGKICVSLLAAFAIVFFRFPGRAFCFWAIFITLMLPVEVRIMPTYKVISDLGMLMIVSATAVFLFRQFFMAVPREIAEASQIDGARPMQFFKSILVPMTRTPIAAMFVIQFIYGWNQYLWPLLITTKQEYYTLLIGINRMLSGADVLIEWQIVMATTLLALIPPVLVVLLMQKQFVAGMTDTEK
jgi:sn-glycerol 3-phosphate transport system permease protein